MAKELLKRHKNKIFILILILLILMVFNLFNKPVYKISTFSEDSEFSFDFPEFKNWEVKRIEKRNNDEYIIHLNTPNTISLEYPPQIRIRKSLANGKINYKVSKKGSTNKFSSKYEYVYFPENWVEDYNPKGNWEAIRFLKDDLDSSVFVEINIGDIEGFSQKVFAKKVTESFKFN